LVPPIESNLRDAAPGIGYGRQGPKGDWCAVGIDGGVRDDGVGGQDHGDAGDLEAVGG